MTTNTNMNTVFPTPELNKWYDLNRLPGVFVDPWEDDPRPVALLKRSIDQTDNFVECELMQGCTVEDEDVISIVLKTDIDSFLPEELSQFGFTHVMFSMPR